MQVSQFLSKLKGIEFRSAKAGGAIAVAFTDSHCRWIVGQVQKKDELNLKKIDASGAVKLDEDFFNEDGLVPAAKIFSCLDRLIAGLPAGQTKPSEVVFSFPPGRSYMGEVQVLPEDDDQLIRMQIEEMLEAVAGAAEKEMAYDWQRRAEMADGTLALAVAAMEKQQVLEVEEACRQLKLKCCGVTLNHIAALNGYVRMGGKRLIENQSTSMLFAELSKHVVRLSIFNNGVFFHENWESSVEEYSIVDAISALERMVGSWSRDGIGEVNPQTKLIVGGELMNLAASDSTLKRSELLNSRYFPIQAHPELTQRWHEMVLPFGAMEGLPCA